MRSFEADATEAMCRDIRQQHSTAQVMPIREISNASGAKREIDGAVTADGCVAILEAKQVLDDYAVEQLDSCLAFIK